VLQSQSQRDSKLLPGYARAVIALLLLCCSSVLAYAGTTPGEQVRAMLPTTLTTQPAATDNSTASGTVTHQQDVTALQVQLPDLNAPVIDNASVLTAQQREALSQQILSIYQGGRAQIGLMVLPTTGQENIFDYVVRAFTAWQLGDEKQDNGLLIVVAVNDHNIQILTGYGLEGVLPDVVVKRIIEEQITPLFKQADYAGGLQAGIQQVDHILQLDPEIARASAEALRQQQADSEKQAAAMQHGVIALLVLSVLGIFATMLLGRPLSASIAGVGGVVWGMISGLGLFASLLLGGAVFFLLITSLAQLILQGVLQSGGRGGGGFGGSGGGYRGGGGSFGGGGASGSW
jgi:uncharacterized protein